MFIIYKSIKICSFVTFNDLFVNCTLFIYFYFSTLLINSFAILRFSSLIILSSALPKLKRFMLPYHTIFWSITANFWCIFDLNTILIPTSLNNSNVSFIFMDVDMKIIYKQKNSIIIDIRCFFVYNLIFTLLVFHYYILYQYP